jgi:hypothetical protein
MQKWKVVVQLPSGFIKEVVVEGVTTKDAIIAAESQTGGKNKNGIAAPHYEKPVNSKGSRERQNDVSPPCFVATVAYSNNPAHPDVVFLRKFRDQRLSKSRLGRSFIAWYYATGPMLALNMQERTYLKCLTRRAISWFVSLLRALKV